MLFYANTFDAVVFVAFIQVHTDTQSVLHTCSSPLQEGRLHLRSPHPVGLVAHH